MKLGCWGPVVQCNVGKRGWMGGIGGCPNVGGICIGCTMPGFPDKFMPFMNQPPGSLLSSAAVQTYGRAIHALRRFTQASLNKEPSWRQPGKAGNRIRSSLSLHGVTGCHDSCSREISMIWFSRPDNADSKPRELLRAVAEPDSMTARLRKFCRAWPAFSRQHTSGSSQTYRLSTGRPDQGWSERLRNSRSWKPDTELWSNRFLR